MKNISFTKVVGAGNDFILVDGRDSRLPANLPRLARQWCDRKRGIGADGLLSVLSSRRADARMRIFNADGSEAEMCGNGLRCVAWYLHATDHGAKNHSVETVAGLMQTRVVSLERVRIFLTPPKGLRLHRVLTCGGTRYTIHSVNTGVPHAVLMTSVLGKVNVAHLGRLIRRHSVFQPAGTNVNWIQIHSPRKISIRTYERGVEVETLACGTGSVASVVVGTALKKLIPPVQVWTASRERLIIGFGNGRDFKEGAFLEGPARVVFQGVLSA